MSVELQNIDCNCNNCKYMVRDFNKFEQSKKDRDRWQLSTFVNTRTKFIRDSQESIMRAQKEKEPEKKKQLFKKGYNLLKIAKAMKYSFNNDSKINYGDCEKLNKKVSFIPDILQIETQECFKNRKENEN